MEIIYDLKNISRIAETLLDFFNSNDSKIIAFNAPMSAGKTTLIKEICDLIGVRDNVTSPTFAIINEYSYTNRRKVYHFDFYRLENIEDALNIGVEDYFYSGNYCFIEWPELVKPILPDNVIFVEIEILENVDRKLIVKKSE